jgi:hypothetical protein
VEQIVGDDGPIAAGLDGVAGGRVQQQPGLIIGQRGRFSFIRVGDRPLDAGDRIGNSLRSNGSIRVPARASECSFNPRKLILNVAQPVLNRVESRFDALAQQALHVQAVGDRRALDELGYRREVLAGAEGIDKPVKDAFRIDLCIRVGAGLALLGRVPSCFAKTE